MSATMPPRLYAIDIARSLALLGMAFFHLTYDLQMFGIFVPGPSATGFLYWHARLVAGSFLFLAGMSLWLAHQTFINWPAFWRRWLKLAGAALLVSTATWFAMPDAYVFFGILHSIALCSLLGLLFLRFPALLTALCGAAVMAGSYILPNTAMNGAAVRFLGLNTEPTISVDFEPLFPWFGPFLLGLACARLLHHSGLLQKLTFPPTTALRRLAWPGQHSLAIYLVHQPILLGLVWLYRTYLM